MLKQKQRRHHARPLAHVFSRARSPPPRLVLALALSLSSSPPRRRRLLGGQTPHHQLFVRVPRLPPSLAMSSAAADRRRAEAVAWLRALLRGCGGGGGGQPLPPPHASEDDLRAALADGALLCAALRRLGCDPAAASDEGTGSAAAAAAAAGEGDVGRFLAAVERMGLPGFSPSDLDTGPVSSVVTCLLALRDQFVSHDVGGLSCSLPEKVMMQSMEFPRKVNDPGTQNSEGRRKIPKNPAMSEPSSPLSQTTLSSISRHAGHSFHDVFQLRQGRYSDLPSSKISEMMKSTSLDNAPTQSLLSVVNVILDELVETKIGEIPYHLACLLRKVILEIERRISTQAEHIRNIIPVVIVACMQQNNLMKAREEKYKSRIRVLEALASGTSDQTHVNSNATNGKAHVSPDHAVHQMKMEKDKTEDKKRLAEKDVVLLVKDKEEDVTRLTKDKEDMAKLLKDKEDIIRLMKEKEEMVWMMREKENMVSLNNGRVEDKHQLTDKDVANSAKYRNEIIKLMKEKEDSNDTIMKLNIELEAMKSSYEGTRILLDSKKKEVLQLLMDKESIEYIVSQLKQELAIERSSHQTHIQELETRAFQANNKLEQRIKEMELMLEDSKTRVRDLEELLESRSQTWEQKEIRLNQFIGLQIQNIQDLRLSSVSIRHEILHCQKRWSEEICDLGQSLKVLTNAAENYHATLEENRKLFNEVQELKGCKANSIAHLYADILNYQLLILYAYLSGNIRVHCRIRPFLPGEDQTSTTIEYVGDNGELILANPAKRGKEGHKLFKFNKVLGPSASQDEVFKEIQPLIRSVLDGYNVCIFAYGQTGSGKTYTMTGPENATEKDWGVNYRALNDLFHISRSRRDTVMYKVSVQMIEIYNEQIHDLLGNSGSEKKYPFGSQALNQPNGLAVPDATMHPVNSSSDVIELMRTGLENRSVGATALNERSSRSHSVVTMHIQGVDLKTGVTLRGALHLVDLAGSGHAKTLMFVQVNPDVSSYAETLSTLKFAERVSGVELGAAKANKEGKDIKEFKEQLSLLKDKIAKKDEEISRLQLQSHNTPRATAKRADSLLKHSSSSPGISSLGSKIQHRRTASGGRIKIVGSRAGSDVDNFSDISDRHSEAGSMQSVDDIQQSREIMGLSKLSMSEMGHNSVDPELPCFGYDDSEGRLSDISDSGLSMGAETDCSMSSVVELTSLPDQDRVSGTQKEQHMAPSTPKDRLHKVATRASRTTTPKTPQSPTLWPKLRDPPPPRSPMSTSTGKVRVTQATSSSRNSSTQKRWT
uniref:Kinesin motor domain-containing protein n=1 Tax=Oryza glumipatula TaxID=40148 RepID=A0A0E0AAU5_9ORYZ